MVDQFDRAQELDAFYRNQALALHRRSTEMKGRSLTHCLECGEKIPEARRKHAPGCTHCIDCAAALEEKRAWKLL